VAGFVGIRRHGILRHKANFPSRKGRKSTLAVKDDGGKPWELPLERASTFFVFPFMKGRPIAITGAPAHAVEMHYYFVPTKEVDSEKPAYVDRFLEVHSFLLMLAKIAHGAAVFEYGLGDWKPLLNKYILTGDFNLVASLIGVRPDFDPPLVANDQYSIMIIRINVRRIRRIKLAIVAEIKLFPFSPLPIYELVVGRLTVVRAVRLLLRSRRK
jgi:hypothetical protein